jgi:hypothetical protein
LDQFHALTVMIALKRSDDFLALIGIRFF